jgi:hypothetical protein
MKSLYFAMPIKLFNSKSDLNDLENLKKYTNILSNLKKKYKDEYKIDDDLKLIKARDPMEVIMYSTMCVMGATSLDGLILPLDFKKYKDLVILEKEVRKENIPIYFFDGERERILTEREIEILLTKQDTKLKTTSGIELKSKKYTISNGDADITYEEFNGKKILKVYHMGSVTEYEIN